MRLGARISPRTCCAVRSCNCNLPCPGFRLPTRRVYCSELPRDLTAMTGSFAAAALNNPPARILPLSTAGQPIMYISGRKHIGRRWTRARATVKLSGEFGEANTEKANTEKANAKSRTAAGEPTHRGDAAKRKLHQSCGGSISAYEQHAASEPRATEETNGGSGQHVRPLEQIGPEGTAE